MIKLLWRAKEKEKESGGAREEKVVTRHPNGPSAHPALFAAFVSAARQLLRSTHYHPSRPVWCVFFCSRLIRLFVMGR